MNVEIKYVKNNIAKIIIEHFSAFEDLRTNFSTLEKNYNYIKRCRSKNLSIQSSKEYITKSCIKLNGEFELGLLFDIISFCKNNFYDRTINLILDNYIKQYIKSNNLILDQNIFLNVKGGSIRQYQLDSMQIALNKQNGIFILGTGAGKTLCAALLIHNLIKFNLTKKILLICPFPDLANQTFKEISLNLKDYNYKINKWFESFKFDSDAEIIVAGSNILRSQYKQYKDILHTFDCVIVDEVQQLKSNNKISEILSDLPAKIRYGFTGTLPDNKHDIWSVKGKIGPVRFNLPSSELRDSKFLTQVKALSLNVNLFNIPKFTLTDEGNKIPFSYRDEVTWLGDNQEFNNILLKIIKSTKNNTLILINQLQHGENLFNLCNESFVEREIYYIRGEVSIEERNKIKEKLEANNNLILIAQVSTFSVGISVNNIHNIIFPGLIGKSSVRVIQSIGRGLRLNYNKTILNLIDVIPNTKYCLKHNEIRKKIYDREKIEYIVKNLC